MSRGTTMLLAACEAGPNPVIPFNPLAIASYTHAWWIGGPRYLALGYGDGDEITVIPDEIGSLDLDTPASVNPFTHVAASASWGGRAAWEGPAMIRTPGSGISMVQPLDHIYVASADAASGTHATWWASSTGSIMGALQYLGEWATTAGSFFANPNVPLDAGVGHVFHSIYDGASSHYPIDGVASGVGNAGGSGAFGRIYLGGHPSLGSGTRDAVFMGFAATPLTPEETAATLAGFNDYYNMGI